MSYTCSIRYFFHYIVDLENILKMKGHVDTQEMRDLSNGRNKHDIIDHSIVFLTLTKWTRD